MCSAWQYWCVGALFFKPTRNTMMQKATMSTRRNVWKQRQWQWRQKHTSERQCGLSGPNWLQDILYENQVEVPQWDSCKYLMVSQFEWIPNAGMFWNKPFKKQKSTVGVGWLRQVITHRHSRIFHYVRLRRSCVSPPLRCIALEKWEHRTSSVCLHTHSLPLQVSTCVVVYKWFGEHVKMEENKKVCPRICNTRLFVISLVVCSKPSFTALPPIQSPAAFIHSFFLTKPAVKPGHYTPAPELMVVNKRLLMTNLWRA